MPFYRIRVCNKNVKRDGKYIEEVSNLRGCLMSPSWERTIPFLWTTEWRNCGWMWVGNHLRGEWCTDRVKYWLSVGARPSQTVAVLLGRVCCGFTAVICRQAFFLLLPFVPLSRVLSLRRLRRKKERLLRRKSRFLLCTVCERKGWLKGGFLITLGIGGELSIVGVLLCLLVLEREYWAFAWFEGYYSCTSMNIWCLRWGEVIY